MAFMFAMILLTACRSNRRVAEGRFIKRHYNHGWHIDLHRNTERARVSASMIDASSCWGPERTEPIITAAGTGPALSQAGPLVAEERPLSKLTEGEIVIYEEHVYRLDGKVVCQHGSASPGGEKPKAAAPTVDRWPDNKEQEAEGPEGDPEKVDQTAIAGFIFAFLLPPVGLYLSLRAKKDIDKNGGQGRGLARAGIVFSILVMSLLLLGGAVSRIPIL